MKMNIFLPQVVPNEFQLIFCMFPLNKGALCKRDFPARETIQCYNKEKNKYNKEEYKIGLFKVSTSYIQ